MAHRPCAAGRLLTAARNGLTPECLRAFRDAAKMSWRYRPDEARRRLTRLRSDARAYLRIVDRADEYTSWSRLKNALSQQLLSTNK